MSRTKRFFAPTMSTLLMFTLVHALVVVNVYNALARTPRVDFATLKNDYPARANAIVNRLKDELDSILKERGVTGTFFVDIEIQIRTTLTGGFDVAIGWQVADKTGKLIGVVYQNNRLPSIPGPEDETWRQAAAGGAYGVMKLLAGEERDI